MLSRVTRAVTALAVATLCTLPADLSAAERGQVAPQLAPVARVGASNSSPTVGGALRPVSQAAFDRAVFDLSRADLYFFTRRMFLARKGFKWVDNWHHKAICDALMRVYRGEVTRLVINIPPRYSKTEIAVVNFIAWALGNHPDSEFIHLSYAATLAVNNTAAARALAQHETYQATFPELVISGDSASKGDWRTTAGGVVYAAGSGGTITGFGAGKMRPGFGGAIVVDDPHKADEARSDVVRKGVIESFRTTVESRCNDPERTPIIVIMQRLHEEDLAGWLLAGGTGEKWEHLNIPAIDEQGRALWPAKHSIERLRVMERASPYVFAGQYMQRPSPLDGGMFKPDMIAIVNAIPANVVRWCRGWDFAGSTDGDWTAGPKLGQLADGRFVIADVVRLREGPHARDAALRNTADRDGPGVIQSVPQDPGQAGKSQIHYLARVMVGHALHTSPESGDKVTRADGFAAQVNVGNVLMLRAPWNKELTDELRVFPNGKYDDQVDGLSRAFARLVGPVFVLETVEAKGL